MLFFSQGHQHAWQYFFFFYELQTLQWIFSWNNHHTFIISFAYSNRSFLFLINYSITISHYIFLSIASILPHLTWKPTKSNRVRIVADSKNSQFPKGGEVGATGLGRVISPHLQASRSPGRKWSLLSPAQFTCSSRWETIRNRYEGGSIYSWNTAWRVRCI